MAESHDRPAFLQLSCADGSAGLLQIAFVGVLDVLPGDPVSKGCACFGIEIQPPFLAPLFELGGLDDGTDHVSASCDLLLLSNRRCVEPLGIGSVQGVAIGHQPFDLLEVLFFVPSHAQNHDGY